MKKLFGTDGIRGKANVYPITPELALLVGKATALVLGAGGNDGRKRVVLGKDTRISGYMLENALTAGLTGMGMDVLSVGPMPTPAVAHLTKSMGAACGIRQPQSGLRQRDQDFRRRRLQAAGRRRT